MALAARLVRKAPHYERVPHFEDVHHFEEVDHDHQVPGYRPKKKEKNILFLFPIIKGLRINE